jgi:copper chaperone CopZ
MHCGGCASKISTSLLNFDGVESADVSPQHGHAVISGNALPAEEALRAAVAAAGDYTVSSMSNDAPAQTTASEPASHQHHPASDQGVKESLYPLFLIVGFIGGVTLLIAVATDTWAVEPLMRHFMAGFFLVFSFFKLLDLAGFVSAYRGYDLIARMAPAWGWAYPFVELVLGVAYLLAWVPVITNSVTFILMLVGAAGVLKALLDRRAIRCACLGTALNLPMTKVTLVEDLTMASMAGGMLVLMISG